MRTVAVILATLGALSAIASTARDAKRGRDVFETTCTGCHALDRAKVGPPLRKIFGQQAGKDANFTYSDAMKTASITWDEANLDKWLTDTETVIPGNDMAFRLNDASKRADIIAYLKQLSGK